MNIENTKMDMSIDSTLPNHEELIRPKLSKRIERDVFKGTLCVKQDKDLSNNFITEELDSLFYKVPKRILSIIDGCPSKVTHIEMHHDEENERLEFCASQKESDKSRFTISVQTDKIFRLMETEGLKVKDIENSLFAINSRQAIIVRAISVYLKRNVQIQEYDAERLDQQKAPIGSHRGAKKNIVMQSLVSDKPDKLYCLVNNDGNQVRRPKMTLGLLKEDELQETNATRSSLDKKRS